MYFFRRKRHLRYANLYDWFVGEKVPEGFIFLHDQVERDKWITQYGELRRHLFDEHLKMLPAGERKRIKEGHHPSQCESSAEEVKPYADRLERRLEDLGYTADCGVGLYHMNRFVLCAHLDHEPSMQECGKLLPLYFEGFEVKYHGPRTANTGQPQSPLPADQPSADGMAEPLAAPLKFGVRPDGHRD